MTGLMTRSLNEMSTQFGVRDRLGITENLSRLAGASERNAAQALALHNKVLHQADALQTMAVKSKGDLADVLFTVRLQRDVYRTATLASSSQFGALLKHSEEFAASDPAMKAAGEQFFGLGAKLSARADAESEAQQTGPRPPAFGADVEVTLGWNGQKVMLAGPVIMPPWFRESRTFRLWQQQHNIATFRTRSP
jgi:hypothetical protein